MKDLKDKYEEDYTVKKWIAILVAVLVLVFLFFIFLMGYSKHEGNSTLGDINDNVSLVISFIGVIATFIVVGNFSQVSAMRDDVREAKNSMKQDNADFKDEILSQIEELKEIPKEIEFLKENNHQIDEIKRTCQQNFDDILYLKEKKDYTPQLVNLLIKIATNKELVALMEVFFPRQNTYPIHVAGEGADQIHIAIVAFRNSNLVFKDEETNLEYTNVDKVSSRSYTASIGKYIALIDEICKNTIDNNPNFSKGQDENIAPDIEGFDNEQDVPNNDNDM
jgi:hypothetical protein